MTPTIDRPGTRRRILMSGGLVGGGVETHVRLLAQFWVDQGHEVTLVAPGVKRAQVRSLQTAGVRVWTGWISHPSHAARWLAKALALAAWAGPWTPRFDLVYCPGIGHLHRWLAARTKRTGRSVYHEVVEQLALVPGAQSVFLELSAAIANSEVVAAEMRTLAPTKPVRVVPFLTSLEPMGPPNRPARSTDRPPRFAFIGRWVAHKQPQWLVESWAEWMQNPVLKNAELWLIGPDDPNRPLRPAIERMLANSPVAVPVRLIGALPREELLTLLAEIDCVLLPSLWEGLPLVLVEAMQRGVPFVAMNAGGIAELSENNPDVEVTDKTPTAFLAGMLSWTARWRRGLINAERLAAWAEGRYGFQAVSQSWAALADDADGFFAQANQG